MFKMIMGGLAVLLLAASVAFWMLRPGTQRTEGSAAPDFALQDQNGQTHRLSDYAGTLAGPVFLSARRYAGLHP